MRDAVDAESLLQCSQQLLQDDVVVTQYRRQCIRTSDHTAALSKQGMVEQQMKRSHVLVQRHLAGPACRQKENSTNANMTGHDTPIQPIRHVARPAAACDNQMAVLRRDPPDTGCLVMHPHDETTARLRLRPSQRHVLNFPGVTPVTSRNIRVICSW